MFPFRTAVLTLVLSSLSLPAAAHREWILPSSTTLSGNDVWVTVDAARSNELFFFDHNHLRLDGLMVTAPDGRPGKPEHMNTGRYRSTFDVRLTQPGTWRLAVITDRIVAQYEENGQAKRWRGSVADWPGALPAGAKVTRVSHLQARTETFVTSGKPNDTALAPTGSGLEMQPLTHPNSLYAGETATFRLVLDGKPATAVNVVLLAGGTRYRDKGEETRMMTDSEGRFSVTWPKAGMYWFSASTLDQVSKIEGAQRRAVYNGTLEVLAP